MPAATQLRVRVAAPGAAGPPRAPTGAGGGPAGAPA